MHRFIINENLNQRLVFLKDRDVIHQIKDVLKLVKGEKVTLGDGQGKEAVGVINRVDKKEVEVEILEIKNKTKAKRKIILHLAILKHDNFEWALEKATEIGVSEIVPVITERTVKIGLPRQRLERIIREAAEQSGQVFLPKLCEAQKFSEAINLAVKNYDSVLFFDFGGEKVSSLKLENKQSVAIFIGPEGGWSEDERAEGEESGAKVFNLGESVLRAETAAIVASFMACY